MALRGIPVPQIPAYSVALACAPSSDVAVQLDLTPFATSSRACAAA
jgi:hypothetical protein